MDETFDRQEETRTILTIHRQHRVEPHMDLKRGKNTFTVQLQHIYSIIAVHFTALLQHIYSIIAVRLQHYCSTFTASLQHISTPAQLQHI